MNQLNGTPIVTLVAFLLLVGLSYAWNSPPAPPDQPGGNLEPPIHAGGLQIKEGSLSIGGSNYAIRHADGGLSFAIDNVGANPGIKFILGDDGNVGIGTEDPQAKLDVEGTVKIVGNAGGADTCNSQTVGTIIFDQWSDRPYACTSEGWKIIGLSGVVEEEFCNVSGQCPGGNYCFMGVCTDSLPANACEWNDIADPIGDHWLTYYVVDRYSDGSSVCCLGGKQGGTRCYIDIDMTGYKNLYADWNNECKTRLGDQDWEAELVGKYMLRTGLYDYKSDDYCSPGSENNPGGGCTSYRYYDVSIDTDQAGIVSITQSQDCCRNSSCTGTYSSNWIQWDPDENEFRECEYHSDDGSTDCYGWTGSMGIVLYCIETWREVSYCVDDFYGLIRTSAVGEVAQNALRNYGSPPLCCNSVHGPDPDCDSGCPDYSGPFNGCFIDYNNYLNFAYPKVITTRVTCRR